MIEGLAVLGGALALADKCGLCGAPDYVRPWLLMMGFAILIVVLGIAFI